MKNLSLSVIIPVYNEEGNLDLLYSTLERVMNDLSDKSASFRDYEFIFINDGSSDNSLAMIKEMSAKYEHCQYIDLSRNFGHQIAVSAGLDNCRADNAVIIDADLQDPPELIIEMFQLAQQGYDVVYAQRKSREGESWFKLFTAKMYYKIMRKITNIDIPLNTGDFRLISRRVVEVLKKMPEQNKFIRGQVAWAGFNQIPIEYERKSRNAGETGYSFSQMLKLAIDGITGFSDLPLKIATYGGFASSFISVLLVIYALVSKFVLQTAISGWTSIIITILFLGGIQLFCIGLIGEYILRIINNSRNRPLYLIKDTSL